MGDRMENMPEERVELHRSSNRVDNMPEVRVENYRSSHRVESLTPDRIEVRRAASRYANMTPERVEYYRSRDIVRTRRRYKSNVEQEWDFENPCAHCGLIWLKQATHERTYVYCLSYLVLFYCIV